MRNEYNRKKKEVEKARKLVRQLITQEYIEEDDQLEVILSNVYEDDIEDILSGQGKFIPQYFSELRERIITVPEEIYEASGIMIFGSRLKSILFSTDVALIRNHNAQAVFGVYPFTPQVSIMQSIVNVSSVPVFLGVGGGTTTGQRSVNLAFQAEQIGAYGVVVNAPMKNEVIREIDKAIDVPIVATISSFTDDYLGKLEAGADIYNVSAGAKTAELVQKIRQEVGKEIPIIATGGPTGESILETINAGANSITYTPPTTAEIFQELMISYRGEDISH
ncbi:hydrolase [Aerococcaceae bacterium DSM 111020]|nr:hydrolase [Aerococcaceae bacterium DSM 111020]